MAAGCQLALGAAAHCLQPAVGTAEGTAQGTACRAGDKGRWVCRGSKESSECLERDWRPCRGVEGDEELGDG